MTRTITLILLLGLLSCCSSGKDDDARKGGGSKPDPDAVGLTLSQQSKTIPENIFGYNTQSIKGPGWDKAEFISRIAELNPGNFRYPGGTVGNFWDWRTGYYNEIGKEVNVIVPSPAGPLPYKLEHVKMVYDRTGAAPVFLINMLTSTYEEQLAMLKYARSIGLPVEYIEMGNEYYLDDHPEKYNYLTKFPETTDYTDLCRVWTAGSRKEFPEARIALIGGQYACFMDQTSPRAGVEYGCDEQHAGNRMRCRDHPYLSEECVGLADPLRHDRADARRCRSGEGARRLDRLQIQTLGYRIQFRIRLQSVSRPVGARAGRNAHERAADRHAPRGADLLLQTDGRQKCVRDFRRRRFDRRCRLRPNMR